MTGTYLHNLDGKGRLFVPANFREELGTCFYVAVGANREPDGTLYQYLNVYPMPEWDRLCEPVPFGHGIDGTGSVRSWPLCPAVRLPSRTPFSPMRPSVSRTARIAL